MCFEKSYCQPFRFSFMVYTMEVLIIPYKNSPSVSLRPSTVLTLQPDVIDTQGSVSWFFLSMAI